MGDYFNPGNESFRVDSNSEIYVDKTGLIMEMNRIVGTTKNCVALSHARRFGKSHAADMLKAYYSKGCVSRNLFEGLEISKSENWDKYLNKFNMIYLEIATFAGNYKENLVDTLKKEIYKELAEKYSEIEYSEKIDTVINKVYQKTGIKFVIIIDEWDAVIRNHADRPDLVHRYMQFLHDLFKSAASKDFLALGYITGIMPIKKIKDESALNNFREFTMVNSRNLARFYGFTEDEVKDLCKKYNMSFDSVHKWYNGYLINGLHMYNPNSVYQSMLDGMLDSYWKNTSAFSTINKYITLNMAGLKDDVVRMMAGEKVKVSVSNFQNDLSIINSKDDALTALIHLGYLGYDERRKQAYIPNYEVSTAFQSAIETGCWPELAKAMYNADSLLFDTIDGKAESVAKMLDFAHDAYSSIIQYNNENSLSCIITMAYLTAPAYYNIERELPAGKGFADMTFIPRKDTVDMPAIVIELKFDKSADAAIRQIKEKRYAGKLSGYADKIMLVGINYDKDTKKHECVIEEYQPYMEM